MLKIEHLTETFGDYATVNDLSLQWIRAAYPLPVSEMCDIITEDPSVHLGQHHIIRQERFARDFLPNRGREPQPYFVYVKA